MASGGKLTRPTPKLEDVCFYFDGVERDRLDAAGVSRRSGEVLALRQRLLQLPEAQFDAAMQALKAMVETGKGVSAPASGRAEGQARANSLFESVRPNATGGGLAKTGKVSPAS